MSKNRFHHERIEVKKTCSFIPSHPWLQQYGAIAANGASNTHNGLETQLKTCIAWGMDLMI
jgi:hypothetical protein